jgi:hypothetical protein
MTSGVFGPYMCKPRTTVSETSFALQARAAVVTFLSFR